MTMLQLNPMLALVHIPTGQKCFAYLIIDYSQEHDLLFGVIRADGQLWVYRTSELRAQENLTLGRNKSPDVKEASPL